ncbi:response regulator [Oxalicibacterium faecigallinarum]|uniref:Response regulatory domain-containing protein n=1 Tax=Oxalicibacterium faecigallinarum TaxID=573741 RepID=A0A8J3F7P9_9BURK|nr:response regulator [Oxalicibacterium faecigallinarum]GGI21640.1 hypothetical protein GCM10008066_30060 [Oxalicibacterium faecigallinarum]
MQKILIVDDERDAVDVLSLMLEMSSFDVVVAYNGAQAFRLIEEKRPDLILSDFMMPELDGVSLCRKVKGDPQTANIPFILMTAAKGLIEDVPADRIITKPIELGNLLETFEQVSKSSAPRLRVAF